MLGAAGDLADDLRHLLVESLPLGISKVLERRRRRIARPHEYEQPFALCGGHGRERLDSIGPGVAVDRDRVGSQNVLQTGQLGILKVSGGVHLRRMADVASLDVSDDFQPQIVGLTDQGVVGFQPLPQVLLEESDIDLHGGHHRRDDAHRLCAKIEDGVDSRRRIVFVVHLTMTPDRGRQPVVDRIQADYQRRLLGLYGGIQPV